MISAPQPSVVHLSTIFRQIAAGELRIPAFQREFVWKDRQVIDLISSVREHYPIGNVLLWYAEQKMLEIAGSQISAFPSVPESYPTNYILDGMQRLTTLYGTFHYQPGQNEIFNVHYDLRTRRFIHEREFTDSEREATIPLASLISPRRMLEHQGRLSGLVDGDSLLDELLQTQAAFQEYMIPIVKILGSDIDRIVGIFERTNSTGTRLDTVDFMRAITWNQTFDLNQALDAIQDILGVEDFKPLDETIIKCVGLLLGVSPSADGLLSLRNRSPRELSAAFLDFPRRFVAVSDFLSSRLNIRNNAYVPYEGQLLVLFKAIGMAEAKTSNDLDDIERWFWATGFNESLRGKPDHYVVRAVENWRGLVQGQIRGLEPRLRLSPSDFFERRLIRGKALSGAFGAMFAAQGARSLLTGHPIPPSLYMSVPDLNSFQTLFTGSELREYELDTGPSPRIFPNIVLTSLFEPKLRGAFDWREQILKVASGGGEDILLSQFIDAEAIQLLKRGTVTRFLWCRAQLLHTKALELVGK